MHKSYHPEMGEAKPEAQIEANLGHYGKHWYLKTAMVLKGRGIKFTGTLKASNLVPQAQRKAGWHTYKVTEAAFEKLASQYDIVSEMLL